MIGDHASACIDFLDVAKAFEVANLRVLLTYLLAYGHHGEISESLYLSITNPFASRSADVAQK